MTKKIKSTVEKLLESLTPEERKKYDEEYQELLLSELNLAIKEKDAISAQKLADTVEVSIISKDEKLQKAYEKIIKKYDAVFKKLAKS